MNHWCDRRAPAPTDCAALGRGYAVPPPACAMLPLRVAVRFVQIWFEPTGGASVDFVLPTRIRPRRRRRVPLQALPARLDALDSSSALRPTRTASSGAAIWA